MLRGQARIFRASAHEHMDELAPECLKHLDFRKAYPRAADAQPKQLRDLGAMLAPYAPENEPHAIIGTVSQV